MSVDLYSLHVGINNYKDPSARLSGCVNDANDWESLAFGAGYATNTLLDAYATRGSVLSALTDLVSSLGYRDRLLFTYSGHGSKVLDQNGDEEDGRDEVMVMQDFTYIRDDDLKTIFDKKPFGSRIMVVSDSCYSGSVNRFVTLDEALLDETPRPDEKFLPPEFLDSAPLPETVRTRSTIGTSSSVLISGCADTEVSYDAYINGRYNGAMTWAAVSAFKPGISVRDWHKGIRALLPSDNYPQSPQLTASYYQSRWTALG